MLPRHLLLPFALLCCAPSFAQGWLPLSGTYRGGSVGSYFGFGPSSLPGIVGDRGTYSFQPNGAFAFTVDVYDVFGNGQVQTNLETGTGIYEVGFDGTMVLDFDPMNPGLDTNSVYLRPDASVFLASRDRAGDESFLWVLVALSSGQSNATLSGAYHVGRLTAGNPGSGMTTRAELGVATFDGNGGYTESGRRHALVVQGTATTSSYNASGSYQVAADGSLALGSNSSGAVSADGALFFWVTTSGTEVALTVGVRRATGITTDLVQGPWGIVDEINAIGAGAFPSGPTFTTHVLDATFARRTPPTVDFTVTGTEVNTDPGGASANPVSFGGSFALGADGTFDLAPTLHAALGDDGRFLLGTEMTREGAGLLVGLRVARSTVFGTGTPGSAAIVPRLQPGGGFPVLGESAFQLVTDRGLGGAPGLWLFGFSPSIGIPLFGGTLWVDPLGLFTTFALPLGGAPGVPGAGSATLPMPVPNDPALVGGSVVVQTVILDGGAPQGLAMTPGLQVTVSR